MYKVYGTIQATQRLFTPRKDKKEKKKIFEATLTQLPYYGLQLMGVELSEYLMKLDFT